MAYEIARRQLQSEVNIFDIIASRRYFNSALNYLIPEKKRLELKKQAEYITVDPDLDEFTCSEGDRKQVSETSEDEES